MKTSLPLKTRLITINKRKATRLFENTEFYMQERYMEVIEVVRIFTKNLTLKPF
jgi:hypothetical protein